MALTMLAACTRIDATPLATDLTTTTSTSVPEVTPTTGAATSTTTTTAAPTTTTTTAPPRPRRVTEQPWVPFATVGGITLHHPAHRVELVGLHQSNHEGAQAMTVLSSAVWPSVLESRDRLTSPATAADVVADPRHEVRAPVTGTVIRAGTYTLYCKYTDAYLVIEPDEHPGWEVKLLHVHGLSVRRGDRVTAGATPVAQRPTQLPFDSQVDDLRTSDPAWPHVHVEVVDPSIENIPSPGGGC